MCAIIRVQPDSPDLCRFWLAALVGALDSASTPIERELPLLHCLHYIWQIRI
jgi:hypothetical protein